MINIKKTVSATIVAATILASCPMVMADGISVVLDGQNLSFDVAPQIIDDYTMVPMRAIFEALNYDVNWDANTQSVIAYNPYTASMLYLQIGNNTIKMSTADDYSFIVENMDVLPSITIPVAPVVINGFTLVPVRVISESAGCTVVWDSANAVVNITSAPQTTVNDGRVYPDGSWIIDSIAQDIDEGLYLEAIDSADMFLDGLANLYSPSDKAIVQRLRSMAVYKYNSYVDLSVSVPINNNASDFETLKQAIIDNGFQLDGGYGLLIPHDSFDMAYLYIDSQDMISLVLSFNDSVGMIMLELYNNGNVPFLTYANDKNIVTGVFPITAHRFTMTDHNFNGDYDLYDEAINTLVDSFLTVCDIDLKTFAPTLTLNDFGVAYDPVS